MYMQYGPGSTGNVIAAVCSFFVPGLGQLVQGRPLKALFMLVLGVVMWFVMLGWLVHICSSLQSSSIRPYLAREVEKTNAFTNISAKTTAWSETAHAA